MKRLRLRVRPRPLLESINETRNTTKYHSDTSTSGGYGSMRLVRGWAEVEQYGERIGRIMPYARRLTTFQVDEQDSNQLRSERSTNSKPVILGTGKLVSSSSSETLPVLSPDMRRTVTRKDGFLRTNWTFQPFPIYKVIESKIQRRTRQMAGEGRCRIGNDLEISYPLFKVEEVKSIEKRPIKISPLQGSQGSVYVTSLGIR